jgi:hypothetical protein
MKKSENYFFRESTLALAESTIAFAVESTFVFAESREAFALSTTADAVESPVLATVSAELLQDATKAPMANTKRSFFIFCVFVCKIMI